MIHFIPTEFLPAIGLVIVQHAFMDSELHAAICRLAGLSYNAGISVLAPVTNTSARATMLQNLARTHAVDISHLCKLLVLGDLVGDLSAERNIVAHNVPDGRSGSGHEVWYFKDVNKTNPQIKIQKPYTATIPELERLAEQLSLVGTWLGMLQPRWMPDGILKPGMSPEELDEAVKLAKHHPNWDDDQAFPWRDKFLAKVRSESQKPANEHLLQNAKKS